MARRRESYLAEASRLFLSGLPHRTPSEAVESGARSLRDWCECLNEARAAHGLSHLPPPDAMVSRAAPGGD